MHRRAVFLDRDGTILQLTNRSGNELYHAREIKILPGVPEAIHLLNKHGFLVIIHTNQAAIARGRLTEKKLRVIHKTLIKRLGRKDAFIDGVYYCPHHPAATIKKYRVVCACRKPGIGMLMQAKKEFDINLGKSVMIGDSSKDIQAGKKAKMKTILLQTGNAGKEKGAKQIKPDAVSKNLLSAARFVIKNYPVERGRLAVSSIEYELHRH